MTGAQIVRAVYLWALAGALVVMAIAAGALIRARGYEFIVNDSPSMPRGVYLIHLGALPAQLGETVVFRPIPAFAHLIYGRGWLPRGMPLIKTVGGLAGDIWCTIDERFVVDGEDWGPVFVRDAQGRVLPPAGGCHRVDNGYFLPVATHLSRSFDGRYMGAVPMTQVIGTGFPLLTF